MYKTQQKNHFDLCFSFEVKSLNQKKVITNSHEGWELLFSTTDNLYFGIRGKTFKLNPNTLFFINAQEQHTEIYHSNYLSQTQAVVIT
jgi:hypothetical protein